MSISQRELARRAAGLEWLLSDVDGVLTDGRLLYGPEGEEMKVFHVRDGLALKLAQRAGLKVGLLSSRGNRAVELRAGELGLDALLLGCGDKGRALAAFLAERGIGGDRVAYLGDDLPDLAAFRHCALTLAPADAAPEVREQAHRVLDRPGGGGAVREAVELILAARGQWRQLVAGLAAEDDR